METVWHQISALQELHISDPFLNDETFQRLLSSTHSLRVKKFTLNDRDSLIRWCDSSKLLPSISSNSQRLIISITTMDADEMQTFVDLLSKNTTEFLWLRDCSFSEEFCSALVTAFPRMTSLQELRIENSSIDDDAAFTRLLSCACSLRLDAFGLIKVNINDQTQHYVCDVIELWLSKSESRLWRLELEELGEWSVETLCHLFYAIGRNNVLRSLTLERMNRRDSAMEDLCATVAALPFLRQLNLNWNAITASGFGKFMNYSDQFCERRLEKLSIRGNEGAGDPCVLQNLVCFSDRLVS
jgi:hypothetical protein